MLKLLGLNVVSVTINKIDERKIEIFFIYLSLHLKLIFVQDYQRKFF